MLTILAIAVILWLLQEEIVNPIGDSYELLLVALDRGEKRELLQDAVGGEMWPCAELLVVPFLELRLIDYPDQQIEFPGVEFIEFVHAGSQPLEIDRRGADLRAR